MLKPETPGALDTGENNPKIAPGGMNPTFTLTSLVAGLNTRFENETALHNRVVGSYIKILSLDGSPPTAAKSSG